MQIYGTHNRIKLQKTPFINGVMVRNPSFDSLQVL